MLGSDLPGPRARTRIVTPGVSSSGRAPHGPWGTGSVIPVLWFLPGTCTVAG